MTGHDHDQAPAASTPNAASATAPASGPVALIRSMIAQGRHAPELVADVIRAHPDACHAIVEVLHQTLGNAFVQTVMGVHATAGDELQVAAASLHVRLTPDATAPDNIIGTLHHHERIAAHGREGTWLRIAYRGRPAFVAAAHVEPVTPAAHAPHESHDHAPAVQGDSRPVTPADVRAVIGDHRDEPAEPVAHDGLIAARVREHAAGYLHDTNDVTSVFPPDLTTKYQACVEQAAAGVLVFPSPKDPPGKTSAPFVAFVKAFYKHFHCDEKRINLDIIKHGGKKAFEMTPYLESLLVDVPAPYCAGRAQRVHRKAEAAFVAMHDAAARDGVSLRILSAYRPPAKHHAPSKNPFAKASNSSHNYGLAIDLQLSGEGLHVHECSTQDMTNTMKYYGSSVTKWMVANAATFDFHPYAMEPWHYEYNPDGMAAEIVEGAKAFGGD